MTAASNMVHSKSGSAATDLKRRFHSRKQMGWVAPNARGLRDTNHLGASTPGAGAIHPVRLRAAHLSALWAVAVSVMVG